MPGIDRPPYYSTNSTRIPADHYQLQADSPFWPFCSIGFQIGRQYRTSSPLSIVSRLGLREPSKECIDGRQLKTQLLSDRHPIGLSDTYP